MEHLCVIDTALPQHCAPTFTCRAPLPCPLLASRKPTRGDCHRRKPFSQSSQMNTEPVPCCQRSLLVKNSGAGTREGVFRRQRVTLGSGSGLARAPPQHGSRLALTSDLHSGKCGQLPGTPHTSLCSWHRERLVRKTEGRGRADWQESRASPKTGKHTTCGPGMAAVQFLDNRVRC